jgi:hypothetical protein
LVCTLACKTSNSAPLSPSGQSVSLSRVLRSCLPWAHVRCLYVPVDDFFRMCGIKGHRQFSCPDRAPPRFPAACQRSGAGASAPQQLHDDEGSSIGLVNLMERANVRVVQEDVALAPPAANGWGLARCWRVCWEGTSGRRVDRPSGLPPHTPPCRRFPTLRLRAERDRQL